MLPFTRVCRRRTPFHMIAGRAMPSDPSRPGPRADAAGVRLVEAPAVRRAAQLLLLGAALICLVAAGAIVVIRLRPRAAAGGPRGAARHGAGRPADPHARARRDGPGALSSPPARARLAVLAAVAASALAFVLYARMTWPWVALGWVGLVPWLAVLDRAASVRAALAAGLLMSLAFVLAVFGWFAAAIGTYTGAPSPVALVLLLAAAPLLEPQLLAFALARHLARRAAFGFWRATLACACAYVGSEWALPKLFGDTLGHGLYASAWMRQAADLAGLRGLVAGPG